MPIISQSIRYAQSFGCSSTEVSVFRSFLGLSSFLRLHKNEEAGTSVHECPGLKLDPPINEML
ncbi:hypothetical protein Agau_L200062 [Agrobacterium tumefaciens F2]|nr:hypothetical protein Agau_L200062 [Agrobacterium tumefaciens F2]